MSTHFPPRRPHSVTSILWGVFLLAGWNTAKVVALAQQSELLASLAIRPNPIIRLIAAVIWAGVLGGSGIGLWRKRPFTRRFIPLTLFLYALYELSLVWLFAQTLLARQGIWPQAVLYALLIGFSWWGLNRTAVNHYFERRNG